MTEWTDKLICACFQPDFLYIILRMAENLWDVTHMTILEGHLVMFMSSNRVHLLVKDISGLDVVSSCQLIIWVVIIFWVVHKEDGSSSSGCAYVQDEKALYLEGDHLHVVLGQRSQPALIWSGEFFLEIGPVWYQNIKLFKKKLSN